MTRREAEISLNAEIGRRLRWARELVYPTGIAFARAMGMDQSLLVKVETGERSISLLNLVTAANKLQVGTEYLLTGDLYNVETSMRRALIDHHPELLTEPWVPDPKAPRQLLVPHRPRASAGGSRGRGSVRRSGGKSQNEGTAAPFPPTIPGAARS